MAPAAKKSRILDFLLIFAIVYLGYTFTAQWFFPSDEEVEAAGVAISMQDASVRQGANPMLVIDNKTSSGITITDRCPLPPVLVFRADANDPTKIAAMEASAEAPCEAVGSIAAGESAVVNLGPWKYSLFHQPGIYELELPTGSGGIVAAANSDESQYREGIITRFTITEPGAFTKLFRTFITKPILNLMIFFASLSPSHSLGLSIILVTLLVKILLFIPTQHALEGQKKMQLLQPKFEAVRKQFADNPQMMQQETMKIWKENKVNPLQACLPLLVQFPILIGLFYVIRDGVNLALNKHLIYSFYDHLDWSFNPAFLGFDLTESYVWVFPPLLVVLQFIQMKLSFHIADKKKAKQLEATTTKAVDTPQEVQQKVMQYALPLMIGFFALGFPSAVSLYWGISTLFAIGQQVIVNREHLNVRA